MRYARVLMIAAIVLLALLLAALCVRYPPLLILVGLAVCYRAGKAVKEYTSHGTARWARIDELERAGMTGGDGLPIGVVRRQPLGFWQALNGQFDKRVPSFSACLSFMLSMRVLQRHEPGSVPLRLNQAIHTVVIAPSGAGKGASIIIPFLLSCRDSVIVLDPKGENFRITAEARRRMGQRVVILDPWGVVSKNPDRLNPLAPLRNDVPRSLDDARAIANEIVIKTGSEPDPHWNDNAVSLITGMIVASLWTVSKSLQDVRALLSDAQARASAIKEMCESREWGGMIARLGNQLANLKDKELAGVLSTANRHTAFLDTLAVAHSTGASSFDPAELLKGKASVYLVLPPQYLKSHSALLRLWIGTLMRACISNGSQEERLVRFVLDEAASLGQMDSLEDAVSLGRGFGARLQFYYQAVGQLKTCWREGRDQALMANCTRVYFSVNDYETAEQVSKQLGDATIVVKSGGTNTGGSTQVNSPEPSSSRTESWGANDNWQLHGRPLLKPEEVIALNPRIAVTFAPGVRPICTALTRYFEPGKAESRWTRLRTAAEVVTTAVLMLLIALGAWWAVLNYPHGR